MPGAGNLRGLSWQDALARTWASWLPLRTLAASEQDFRAGAAAQRAGQPAERGPHGPDGELWRGSGAWDRERHGTWLAGWGWRAANPGAYLPERPVYVELYAGPTRVRRPVTTVDTRNVRRRERYAQARGGAR